jgi:hypothetical protein
MLQGQSQELDIPINSDFPLAPDIERGKSGGLIHSNPHDRCDELISELRSRNSKLELEKEEYKLLLFQKVGLSQQMKEYIDDVKQVPLRANKTWGQKKEELEKKYRKEKAAPEVDKSTAGVTGTVTE